MYNSSCAQGVQHNTQLCYPWNSIQRWSNTILGRVSRTKWCLTIIQHEYYLLCHKSQHLLSISLTSPTLNTYSFYDVKQEPLEPFSEEFHHLLFDIKSLRVFATIILHHWMYWMKMQSLANRTYTLGGTPNSEPLDFAASTGRLLQFWLTYQPHRVENWIYLKEWLNRYSPHSIYV